MDKSACGSGRGRGWMRLNNAAVTNPGGTPSQDLLNSLNKVISHNELDTNESTSYTKLLAKFEQINVSDDGIALNKKIKHIFRTWQDTCKNGNEIKQSLLYIYSKCLFNDSLASKVIVAMTLRSFNVALHDIKLRSVFIQFLQDHYEHRVTLQRDNPVAFRNFARMLGEFLHRNCHITRVLQRPALVCLEMLLKSGQQSDLSLFTTLLYLNGSGFNSAHPETLALLLVQVREFFITQTNLNAICKTWLLLALDIANCRFGLLPRDIHKFYENKLGESEMIIFQGVHSSLSIETSYPNKTLDSYKSSVSVLQITPPECTSPIDQTSITHNNWQPLPKGKRLGRPILGVGIRGQSNGEQDIGEDSNKQE